MDCFCKWKQYSLLKINRRKIIIQNKLDEAKEEFDVVNNNVK